MSESKQNDVEPELLRAPQAAKLIGVSQSFFYSMIRTGKLGPMPLRLGGAVRWRKIELRKWVNAGCPPRARWS
ncbi:MAG: helix-turn-helix domain-containing protein [Phycisphaerae bacterium]|nr:helix-turn-helix domain-containing protein [Phycisphaerae bacterium]